MASESDHCVEFRPIDSLEDPWKVVLCFEYAQQDRDANLKDRAIVYTTFNSHTGYVAIHRDEDFAFSDITVKNNLVSCISSCVVKRAESTTLDEKHPSWKRPKRIDGNAYYTISVTNANPQTHKFALSVCHKPESAAEAVIEPVILLGDFAFEHTATIDLTSIQLKAYLTNKQYEAQQIITTWGLTPIFHYGSKMPWSISVHRAPRKSTWILCKDSRGRWYSQALDISLPAVPSRGRSQIRSREHSAPPRARSWRSHSRHSLRHRTHRSYSSHRRPESEPLPDQWTSWTTANKSPYTSSLSNLVLLIEDIRAGQTMNHQSVDLEVFMWEMANPQEGFWADAKEVCEKLQASLSRIDGPAQVFATRGTDMRLVCILRITADGVSEFPPENLQLRVNSDYTLDIQVIDNHSQRVYLSKDTQISPITAGARANVFTSPVMVADFPRLGGYDNGPSLPATPRKRHRSMSLDIVIPRNRATGNVIRQISYPTSNKHFPQNTPSPIRYSPEASFAKPDGSQSPISTLLPGLSVFKVMCGIYIIASLFILIFPEPPCRIFGICVGRNTMTFIT